MNIRGLIQYTLIIIGIAMVIHGISLAPMNSGFLPASRVAQSQFEVYGGIILVIVTGALIVVTRKKSN
ncbi:MAG: hypothetical protein NTY03_08705 [Candidatus Bathyarchaeota archaeon]|nr:hypothetical protein [Candidatus Bathyarchaeota archaeon]